MNSIRAVLIPASPLEPARIVEVDGSAESLSALIGAVCVDSVPTPLCGVVALADGLPGEDAPANRRASLVTRPRFVAGDIALVGSDHGRYVPITVGQLRAVAELVNGEGVA